MTGEVLTPIAQLRAARGETLDLFAVAVGSGNKSWWSAVERGLRRPTPDQALAIERLSAGTIDAGALNPVIAAARASEFRTHGGDSAVDDDLPQLDRLVLCDVCERRLDDPAVRSCSYSDCPRAGNRPKPEGWWPEMRPQAPARPEAPGVVPITPAPGVDGHA